MTQEIDLTYDLGLLFENMALIRQRAGLSQDDLAQVLGVNRSAVSQWENGRNGPGFEIAVQLQRILITLQASVGGIPLPSTEPRDAPPPVIE